MRLQVVSDVDTAMAVLRASIVKGEALERLIATPAWSPVLSLESIDGKCVACCWVCFVFYMFAW
jgi:hypothetical protein